MKELSAALKRSSLSAFEGSLMCARRMVAGGGSENGVRANLSGASIGSATACPPTGLLTGIARASPICCMRRWPSDWHFSTQVRTACPADEGCMLVGELWWPLLGSSPWFTSKCEPEAGDLYQVCPPNQPQRYRIRNGGHHAALAICPGGRDAGRFWNTAHLGRNSGAA